MKMQLLLLPLLALLLLFASPVAGAQVPVEENDDSPDRHSAPRPAEPASEEDDEAGGSRLFGGPFRLEVRAGYTGTMWIPKSLEPYQVDRYGRNLMYAEIAVHHPLLILGEAFDVVQVPRLRIETNFGYSSESATFEDLMPTVLRRNPYLKSASWLTFFRYLSLRYQEERFVATVSDPRAWGLGIPLDSELAVRDIENRMRDLEVGLIGSMDGRVHETMVEIGYYRSQLQWPMVELRRDSEGALVDALLEREIVLEGIYGALNTSPIPHLWPLETQFMLRIGGVFGVDARFRFERDVWKSASAGVELVTSWRWIQAYEDEAGTTVEIGSNNPRDTRYRVTVYVLVGLL